LSPVRRQDRRRHRGAITGHGELFLLGRETGLQIQHQIVQIHRDHCETSSDGWEGGEPCPREENQILIDFSKDLKKEIQLGVTGWLMVYSS